MPRYHKPPDTLEQIVEDAIQRESKINQQHPERHGYGMVKGEADDLIRRIENLELKQLHAQKEKIKNREKKIRLIGADKLYTHSPEDLVIEAEEKKPIKDSVNSVLDKFPERRDAIFALHEQGYKKIQIAKILGISRYIVGREIKKAENELKEKFEGGING